MFVTVKILDYYKNYMRQVHLPKYMLTSDIRDIGGKKCILVGRSNGKLKNVDTIGRWERKGINIGALLLAITLGICALAVELLYLETKTPESKSYLRSWAFSLLSGCRASAISRSMFVRPLTAESPDMHASTSVTNLWTSESSIKGRLGKSVF